MNGTKLVLMAVALAAGGFLLALGVSQKVGRVGGPRGARFYTRVDGAQAAPAAALPVLGTVPYFELTRADGQRISRAELGGKVWIADFIFTHCTGPCAAMTMRMKQLEERLRADSGIQLVSLTVDPGRDTPAVLAQYAGLTRADAARWWFLTGPQETIWKLSRDGFKLSAGENVKGSPEYALMPFFHSTRFVLVDQQARIRGYYDGVDPDALRRLLTDARALVASRGIAPVGEVRI
jgi:protein SCO1/2